MGRQRMFKVVPMDGGQPLFLSSGELHSLRTALIMVSSRDEDGFTISDLNLNDKLKTLLNMNKHKEAQ